MQINAEVREIEQVTMKDGSKFTQVTFLDTSKPRPLKQFISWNVMESFKDTIKGLKEGDIVDFQVTKIETNYDNSLRFRGEIIPQISK